jgi:hypothetical protein
MGEAVSVGVVGVLQQLYTLCARYFVDLSHANSDTNSVYELQTQQTGSMVISGNTSLMSMPISIETPSLENYNASFREADCCPRTNLAVLIPRSFFVCPTSLTTPGLKTDSHFTSAYPFMTLIGKPPKHRPRIIPTPQPSD